MKSMRIMVALGVAMSLLISAVAQAAPPKHSAAWYRAHRKKVVVVHKPKHSAAWYRTHRKKTVVVHKPKHSAAWYRTHHK